MTSITRNVPDISPDDRRALEHVLGQSLRDDQQVFITVTDSQSSSGTDPAKNNHARLGLPEWMNVYKGLSEAEIDEVESLILSRDRTSRTIDLE